MNSDFSNPLGSTTKNPSPAAPSAGAAGNGSSLPRPITLITSSHRIDAAPLSRHIGLRRTDSPNLTARVHDPAIEALKSHPILGTKYKLNVHSPKTFVSGYAFLWRGCLAKELKEIAENRTASGIKAGAEKSPKITDEQAKKQVGEQSRFPEFSSEKSKVQGFGRGSLIALFKIKLADLRPGSETEAGWVCNIDTEVDIVAWHEGQQFKNPPIEPFGLTTDRKARMLEKIKAGRPATPSSLTSRTNLVLVKPIARASDASSAAAAAVSDASAATASASGTNVPPAILRNAGQSAPIVLLNHGTPNSGGAIIPQATASNGSLQSNGSLMGETQAVGQAAPLSPMQGAMSVMPTSVRVNNPSTNGQQPPPADAPCGCCDTCTIL